MSRSVVRRLVSPAGLLALAALLVAGCPTSCGEPAPEHQFVSDLPGNTLDDGGAFIRKLTAKPNPRNVLSYYVEWKTSVPSPTRLDVHCGEGWQREYRRSEPGRRHRVFVMGLWAEAECQFVARGESTSGSRAAESVSVTVGTLPDFLPKLRVGERQADRVQPGWTMFNLTNKYSKPPLKIGLVDSEGRYRWYHEVDTPKPGTDNEISVVGGDKILVGGDRNKMEARLLNWQGEVLWKDNLENHHDIRPDPWGDGLLYITERDACEDAPNSDVVVKYDIENKQELDQWVFCDMWLPGPGENLGPDWDHMNTIEPFPDERAILLGSRHTHSVFKLDLDESEIVWKLGRHSDFDVEGDGDLYTPHAPEILPNGNILVFDNGAAARRPQGPRGWSRVVEFSYDPETMTGEVVWEFRPESGLFAKIWGDADRLDNGNTLVTFGFWNKNEDKNSRILEVTPEKEVVWSLFAENRWSWYRSDRITDLPVGEVLPRDPPEDPPPPTTPRRSSKTDDTSK